MAPGSAVGGTSSLSRSERKGRDSISFTMRTASHRTSLTGVPPDRVAATTCQNRMLWGLDWGEVRRSCRSRCHLSSLSEVVDVGAGGLEDPQAQQAEHGDQGEVIVVGRLPTRRQQTFELQM